MSQTVTSSPSQSPCEVYIAKCFPELPHFNNTLNWVLLLLLCYNQPRQHIKKQRHYFANKGLSSQSFGFSSSHVWMWELDHKEGWALQNWCFWTVVLEKTLESPLDCKHIKLLNPKGNQSWIFIGRTDDEAETPILWPPDAKNWLTGKDPDAGKDWRQEEKGMTKDEIVGWHHRLNGHEFEEALGVGDGQGSLPCCSPWGRKESEGLSNWTEQTEKLGETDRGWGTSQVTVENWNTHLGSPNLLEPKSVHLLTLVCVLQP